jgi:Ran GTPase-activating protein (RanGAP) involved in mRNA processing and transport
MEDSAKSVILNDPKMSREQFDSILGRFFNSWQLRKLEKLDISGSNLGLDGAVALAEKLHSVQTCHLVALNVGYNNLGDMGTSKLLNALVLTGCVATLERLDLPGNRITMSLDAIAVLGRFVRLR